MDLNELNDDERLSKTILRFSQDFRKERYKNKGIVDERLSKRNVSEY